MISNARLSLLSLSLIGLLSPLAHGADESFEQCKVRLSNAAIQAGVSQSFVDNTMVDVAPIKRTLALDSSQPEFRETFAEYMLKRITDWRVQEGRRLYQKHHELLKTLTHEYGVPGQYLIAFWGLETNFGSYKGKMPTVNAIATLACDQRRRDYFTQEFVEVMKLAENNGFKPHSLQGSWAGAVGHTQFMPTAYNAYAVDGDGDGVIDLWNSEIDALTSAANFLQQLGWKSGERWGREVVIPNNYNIDNLGRAHRQPLSYWREQGLVQANGVAIPKLEMEAGLLLPLGYKGPAFLTYHNFDVIMRWNRSESYALSVGHLANRIAGGGGLQVNLAKFPKLRVEQLEQVQQQLNLKGYDVGKPDGRLGPKTRAGIQAYQRDHKLMADGYPNQQFIGYLLK
ncbi:lytic murein transglycosylase [Paraferrimonas haliotis]|uniref:Lytic transglycosylase n=1 Tax=Paraferrimonas haliotis TaxID=2013866 RepID=A0AA37TMR1_9GAMM|nr:lytic murein transglycosylase [Paraferrimonas haliotis]GLS84479.1 lytic transglycosylase [Paraferrimonas haliotis]